MGCHGGGARASAGGCVGFVDGKNYRVTSREELPRDVPERQ